MRFQNILRKTNSFSFPYIEFHKYYGMVNYNKRMRVKENDKARRKKLNLIMKNFLRLADY